VDCLALSGSNQPVEPPVSFLHGESAPHEALRHTALVIGREHRELVEHSSECGTSIAPELLNHGLYIGFLWVCLGTWQPSR
jgi:hypothetical protein